LASRKAGLEVPYFHNSTVTLPSCFAPDSFLPQRSDLEQCYLVLPTKSTLTASVLTHSLFTSSYWQTPQSGTFRQSNPTSHLCSLLCTVCTVSSTAHVQNSVLNNECLDKYAFHLCSSPSALGLRAPRDRPDARVQNGVSKYSQRALQLLTGPNGFHSPRFTRFDSGGQHFNSRVASGSR
jgi:hypothetical protein